VHRRQRLLMVLQVILPTVEKIADRSLQLLKKRITTRRYTTTHRQSIASSHASSAYFTKLLSYFLRIHGMNTFARSKRRTTSCIFTNPSRRVALSGLLSSRGTLSVTAKQAISTQIEVRSSLRLPVCTDYQALQRLAAPEIDHPKR
jgi:hypothetical protein